MGNMTSYGNVAYTWDGKQLVDICILPTDVHISYSYNEDGLRIVRDDFFVLKTVLVQKRFSFERRRPLARFAITHDLT